MTTPPRCLPCLAGEMSLGGGNVFNEWVGTKWPVQFHTECKDYYFGRHCNGWTMNGTFVESGDHSDHDAIDADLILDFELVVSGSLSFTFKVDSERGWDGLEFYVDDVQLMELTSFEPLWKTLTFDLPQGLHKAIWRYHKDASMARYMDRAQIQRIVIEGTSYADAACTKCAPGTSSAAHSGACTPCRTDTYAPGYGTPSCLTCEAGKFARSGASICSDRPPCTEADFQWLFTDCTDSGVRTKYPEWYAPKICDENIGIHLPPSQPDQPCAPCNPGEEKNPRGLCQHCKDGFWSPGNDAPCEYCPAGSAVAKSLSMKYFGRLPLGATTSCHGDMCGTGWRAMNTHLDSGSGHMGSVIVALTMPVTLEVRGRLTFRVRMNAGYDSTFLAFYLDEDTMAYWGRHTSYFITFHADVPEGYHTLKWEFMKEMYQDGEEREFAELTDITLTGTSLGGALSCDMCLPGTAAKAGAAECTGCTPGHWSAQNASRCEPCKAGTYAVDPLATECLTCPPGTTSLEGATECTAPDCTFRYDEKTTYNLAPLSRSDHMYGPIFDKDKGHAFYLNMCSKEHTNHTCYDKEGHAIPSYACQVLPAGYSVDAGDMIAFTPAEPDPQRGLVVTFLHGDVCASVGRNRMTIVNMTCDPNAGFGYPAALKPVEDPTCVYHFEWTTAYACRLCTVDDIVELVGACVDGKSLTHYAFHVGTSCFGGVTLPPSVETECSLGISFPVSAIVGIVLAFVAVIVVVVILCKRNRTLAHRYALLKDQNENFRLSDLTSTSLQDEDEDSHRMGTMPKGAPAGVSSATALPMASPADMSDDVALRRNPEN